jgi:hypothetical protein
MLGSVLRIWISIILGKPDPNVHQSESCIRIRIKVKFQKLYGLKNEAMEGRGRSQMEAWRIKMS